MVAKFLDTDPAPEEFLELQGQLFPYVPRSWMVLLCGHDQTMPYQKMKAKEVVVGDRVYMEYYDDDEAVQNHSLFLGIVICTNSSGIRVQMVDAHVHQELPEADKSPYADFPPLHPLYLVDRQRSLTNGRKPEKVS